MSTATRTVPHDLEAEGSVLGAILLDPDAIARVLDRLDPEDFHRENNGHIYRAALELFREGEPIDNVTLAGRLAKAGVLERVGGRAHLALLRESVPTAANVEHYARIVRDRALKRRIIAAGTASAALGYDESLDADEALNRAQAVHFALTPQRAGGGLVRLSDRLTSAFEAIHDQTERPDGAPTGISSDLRDLDLITNGFQPSDLVVVAGAASMGKTALALQLARAAAAHETPVAVFSLEMSALQLVRRMLCSEARVDSQRLARGMLGEAELERLAKALGPLGDAPIWIDDTPVLDDLTLTLLVRQAVGLLGIKVVVVDYLQLMTSATRSHGGNRVQEVSAITRTLKAIAREMGVTVLALSQLSRTPSSRPDKRPILSDLRESGSIEMDADMVIFVYRDEYYNREKSEKPGIAEIIVAKHRNGPTGTVELAFRKELTRFESLERHRRMEPEE